MKLGQFIQGIDNMSYDKDLILSFVKSMLIQKDIEVLSDSNFLRISIKRISKYDSYIDIDFDNNSLEVIPLKTTELIGIKKVIDNKEIIYELLLSKGKVKHLNIWSADRTRLPHDELFLKDWILNRKANRLNMNYRFMT